jgi:hypothetical protein
MIVSEYENDLETATYRLLKTFIAWLDEDRDDHDPDMACQLIGFIADTLNDTWHESLTLDQWADDATSEVRKHFDDTPAKEDA